MNTLHAYLSGKKTFLISLAGVAFSVAINEGWIHLTHSSVNLILGLLGFGGLAALRAGVAKAQSANVISAGAAARAAIAPPAKPNSGFAHEDVMLLVLAVMFIAIAADFVIGCAPLQPGADPLVVRTEQTEQVARATFDSLVALDDSDRGFWRTNAPAFHGFCEWLREPITIEVSNTQPRGLAMILSLDDVKNAYESANASSNSLYTAWATFQATLDQANSWLTIVTNQPPTP